METKTNVQLIKKWQNSGLLSEVPDDLKLKYAQTLEEAFVFLNENVDLPDKLTPLLYPIIYRLMKSNKFNFDISDIFIKLVDFSDSFIPSEKETDAELSLINSFISHLEENYDYTSYGFTSFINKIEWKPNISTQPLDTNKTIIVDTQEKLKEKDEEDDINWDTSDKRTMDILNSIYDDIPESTELPHTKQTTIKEIKQFYTPENKPNQKKNKLIEKLIRRSNATDKLTFDECVLYNKKNNAIISHDTNISELLIICNDMLIKNKDSFFNSVSSFFTIPLYINNMLKYNRQLIFLNYNFLFKSTLYNIFKRQIGFDTVPIECAKLSKSKLLKKLKSKDINYYDFLGILIYLLVKYNLNDRSKYIQLFYSTVATHNENLISSIQDNPIFNNGTNRYK